MNPRDGRLASLVVLAGAPFSLYYESDRNAGNLATRTFAIHLTGATLPGRSVTLDVTVVSVNVGVTVGLGGF